jgi:hypothetical protein
MTAACGLSADLEHRQMVSQAAAHHQNELHGIFLLLG